MDILLNAYNYLIRYFSLIRITDFIDVLIVSYLVYKLLTLLKNTRAMQIIRAIVVLVVLMRIASISGLNVLNFLFTNTVQLGLLALVILFQPELRKMLEQVGSSNLSKFFEKPADTVDMSAVIVQIVDACTSLSESRTGALIVIERNFKLADHAKTGVTVDAAPSRELFKNIFFLNSPLHDGAVIIINGRIAAAGCMLPLSSNTNLSREIGMRHRAAVGMSEVSDAVCVVVSEETGSLSVALNGMLKRHLSGQTLDKLLRTELLPKEDAKTERSVFNRFKGTKE